MKAEGIPYRTAWLPKQSPPRFLVVRSDRPLLDLVPENSKPLLVNQARRLWPRACPENWVGLGGVGRSRGSEPVIRSAKNSRNLESSACIRGLITVARIGRI